MLVKNLHDLNLQFRVNNFMPPAFRLLTQLALSYNEAHKKRVQREARKQQHYLKILVYLGMQSHGKIDIIEICPSSIL